MLEVVTRRPMKWGVQQSPEERAAGARARHAARRAAGHCIYDRRDHGGPEHGPPVKGSRCQVCWDKKVESHSRKREERRKASS